MPHPAGFVDRILRGERPASMPVEHARAENRLGERFDLRRFHNAVIDGGALPLAVLEQSIDEWIAGEMAAAPTK